MSKESFDYPDHAKRLLKQMMQQTMDGKNGDGFCDVVLIAGKNGQRFPAHRVVLAQCSRFFAAMFTRDMLESHADEVTLGDDVHGDYLQLLVQFCYTGKIEVTGDTVDELVQTASRLGFNDVVTNCCEFMHGNLDASNCLGVASLAELLNLSDLKNVAEIYANKYFMQVRQQEEFLQLNAANLMVLIGSNHLFVQSEESVFYSVISWLHYESADEGNRSKHIPALLSLVRLSLLPKSLLAGRVKELCRKHSCLPLLQEAYEEANLPIESRRIKPRKALLGFLVMYRNGIGIYSSVEDNAWTFYDTTQNLPKYFAAAFFNGELIITGGLNDHGSLNTIESQNLFTMKSSILPSMKLRRYNHSIAVLNRLLYVGGGFGSAKNVECYNPINCTWSFVASMSVGRSSFGLAVLVGRLYAVGGSNCNREISSTECYDPKTDAWTKRANLNIARRGFGLASGNGVLYAVGGYANKMTLESIECYDAQADKWTQVCSLRNPRFISCTFLDDRLLVFSIDKENMDWTSFEEYNIATNTCKQRATLERLVPFLRAISL